MAALCERPRIPPPPRPAQLCEDSTLDPWKCRRWGPATCIAAGSLLKARGEGAAREVTGRQPQALCVGGGHHGHMSRGRRPRSPGRCRGWARAGQRLGGGVSLLFCTSTGRGLSSALRSGTGPGGQHGHVEPPGGEGLRGRQQWPRDSATSGGGREAPGPAAGAGLALPIPSPLLCVGPARPR